MLSPETSPQDGNKTKEPGILILNPGSSSLKWAFFESPDAVAEAASGQISPENKHKDIPLLLERYSVGTAIIRLVHGGRDFFKPLIINKDILHRLQRLKSMAPLHNQEAYACSELLFERAPAIRQIAVFDTEFFQGLPLVSQLYGLPRELTQKYGIRRFGFHGFAHQGMLNTWKRIKARGSQHKDRLITIQLGSGCSMAALKGGHPLDTTMGFTPNEGLLMSTRCGDIDPGLLTWLQDKEGWTPQETDRILNQESGWLGVSGESSNMAELLASDSTEAAEAIELLIHRVRKNLGAYYVLLGGLDAILISGGVAERALSLCHRLLTGLEHLGIFLDSGKLQSEMLDPSGNGMLRLTQTDSKIAAWCVRGSESRSMLDSVSETFES